MCVRLLTAGEAVVGEGLRGELPCTALFLTPSCMGSIRVGHSVLHPVVLVHLLVL